MKLSPMSFILRALIFIACISSGGALLAKVYGVAEMQAVTLWLFVPCVVLIAGIYLATRHTHPAIHQAILLGAIGGLLGTFGYDLIRVPFLLMGQRVFAPISAYGVWLADAQRSSRFTETLGWAYHFSNGISFGIMYAVWMRGRHWGWGVLWAMLLETIAVISPFADIFALRQAYGALGIAYLGHVAYGIPLGVIVQKWDSIINWWEEMPATAKMFALSICLLALLSPLINPSRIAHDQQNQQPHSFIIDGETLNPDWLRLERNRPVTITNPHPNPVQLANKSQNQTDTIPAEGSLMLQFEQSGIYQLYIPNEGRSYSSFVIVEPVEDLDG